MALLGLTEATVAFPIMIMEEQKIRKFMRIMEFNFSFAEYNCKAKSADYQYEPGNLIINCNGCSKKVDLKFSALQSFSNNREKQDPSLAAPKDAEMRAEDGNQISEQPPRANSELASEQDLRAKIERIEISQEEFEEYKRLSLCADDPTKEGDSGSAFCNKIFCIECDIFTHEVLLGSCPTCVQ